MVTFGKSMILSREISWRFYIMQRVNLEKRCLTLTITVRNVIIVL